MRTIREHDAGWESSQKIEVFFRSNGQCQSMHEECFRCMPDQGALDPIPNMSSFLQSDMITS